LTERIKGGLADGMPDSAFDMTELHRGIMVEAEHTDDPDVAKEIAKDHLAEDAEYYRKLATIEENPSPRVADHYEEFHGTEPSVYLEGKTWVPGSLVEVGPAVDVGYGIVEAKSNKDGKYVHDFGAGVKMYRRAKNGEKADAVYDNFPSDLMVLGDWLGATVKTNRGKKEIKGSSRTKIATTPDRKTLVVVHESKGVLYIMRGGNMRTNDWIYD
jgi:hypothetical protein